MTPDMLVAPAAAQRQSQQRPPIKPAGVGVSSIVVTGQPNVGKSVVFHLLTGRYVTVSNYPGTTVMGTIGHMRLNNQAVEVHDTPGINSLIVASEDESVARDVLLNHAGSVLQIADAKNLSRALVLSLELAEAGLPLVLQLNMIDEARERRIAIDMEKLSALLGVAVVPTIATQRWGIERLRRALPQAACVTAAVKYPPVVVEALSQMKALLPGGISAVGAKLLLWLAGDESIGLSLMSALDPEAVSSLRRIVDNAKAQSAKPLGLVISEARRRAAEAIARACIKQQPSTRREHSSRLAAWSMHPVWGVPILLLVLAAMYFLVGDLAAQKAVGWLETVFFGRYATPFAVKAVNAVIPRTWFAGLLVGEYGLFTMALPYAFAIILPIVGMFFLCFGLLEDVGYLPRLAIMAHRGCRLLGMNGKAVLPLLLGLGCGTMATMSTRILETRRDRILATLLLAVGVPCSAQLGVVMAMLAGNPAGLLIWAAIVLGVLIAVGKTAAALIPGEESPFLYELPPLRRPKLSNVLLKTLGRMEWYVREAVPLFFLGTAALYMADSLGWLARMEHFAQPLVTGWLGLPAKATEALLIGFLRRDFGAAGFYALQRSGQLNSAQTVASLVTITLFVPCIAQYFMMVKERGWKTAAAIAGLSVGLALVMGGLVLRVLTAWAGAG